jgi:hypothetical protein
MVQVKLNQNSAKTEFGGKETYKWLRFVERPIVVGMEPTRAFPTT